MSTWTKEKPIVPGHYWVRQTPEEAARVVCVTKSFQVLEFNTMNCWNMEPFVRTNPNVEWAGPLAPPK